MSHRDFLSFPLTSYFCQWIPSKIIVDTLVSPQSLLDITISQMFLTFHISMALSITGQVLGTMTLDWELSRVCLTVRTRKCVLRTKTAEVKSQKAILKTLCQVTINMTHNVEGEPHQVALVVIVRFLHCKITFSSPFPHTIL